MPSPPPPAAPAPGCPPALVRSDGRNRTLAFAEGEIQSVMLLAAPERLLLAYCRAIMGFALFVPRPRHIIMVGLGGGSLAKFCYRHFPDCKISVLEVRADVIALREAFCVPPDDARLQVIHADATLWMAQQAAPGAADVIIVDGFDGSGLPAALGSARFYGHCRRALADGGVLVANVFSYEPRRPAMLARLGLMFDSRLCRLAGVAGNNHIVFAVKAAPDVDLDPEAAPRALRMQRALAKRDGLGAGWLNRLLLGAVLAWLTRPQAFRKTTPAPK
jgi:spermidine synthase